MHAILALCVGNVPVTFIGTCICGIPHAKFSFIIENRWIVDPGLIMRAGRADQRKSVLIGALGGGDALIQIVHLGDLKQIEEQHAPRMTNGKTRHGKKIEAIMIFDILGKVFAMKDGETRVSWLQPGLNRIPQRMPPDARDAVNFVFTSKPMAEKAAIMKRPLVRIDGNHGMP